MEVATNSLKAKRSRTENTNPNCRLCKINKETIQHIVAAYPKLCAAMYLPLRHNIVCNVVYQNIIQKDTEKAIQSYYANERMEVWWDTKIKTLTKCEHNKPDIVLWQIPDKKYYIIDVCVCLDVNIDKNIQLKLDNYLPLTAELERVYNDYTFESIPIVVGATGLITSHVSNAMKKLSIRKVCLPSLQILPGDSRFLRQSPGHLQVANYLQVFHSNAKYLQVANNVTHPYK